MNLGEFLKSVQKHFMDISQFDTVESIVINIKPTFLPLFFQDDSLEKALGVRKVGHKYHRREGTPGNYRYFYDDSNSNRNFSHRFIEDDEKEKTVTKKFISYNIVDVDDAGVYFKDKLTGKEFDIDDSKSIEENRKEFTEMLYDEYYDETFEEISPIGTTKLRNRPGNPDFNVYDQFEDEPVMAAHFMTQRYIESHGREVYMICKNVMKVKIGNRKVNVDFTFDNYQQAMGGIGILKMSRKHLDDFRIYSIKDRLRIQDLSLLRRQDLVDRNGNSLLKSVDFDYIIQLMSETCVKRNLEDEGSEIVFTDRSTGWYCVFAKRYASSLDEQNDIISHLELVTFHNKDIPGHLKSPNTRDDALLIRKLKG